MSHWNRFLTPCALVITAGALPCQATVYLTLDQAQKVCFPGATSFGVADVALSPAQMKAIEKDSGINVRSKYQKVWRAVAGEKFLGWCIADEVLGKHEYITWMLALNSDGSVKQIEIIEYRETYGYEIRDEKWRSQFYGRRHGAKLKLDDDIKNLSGATLSSRHITDGVRRLLSLYDLLLKT